MRRNRDLGPPPLPDGFVAPNGYLLVTRASWHTLQLTLKTLALLFVLLLPAVGILELQLSSRNRDIDTVKRAANDAKVAAETANVSLQAAIAQGQSQDSAQFVIAVKQIQAVCFATVGTPKCNEIETAVRAFLDAQKKQED